MGNSKAPDPKEVLARMMRDLAEKGWPSDATWSDARAALGKVALPPLPAGKPVTLVGGMTPDGPASKDFAPAAALTEGYGVRVRQTEVRCDDGISTIAEWQVWAKAPPKKPGRNWRTGEMLKPAQGRYGISRRFTFERDAVDYAQDLRRLRKESGNWSEEGKWVG